MENLIKIIKNEIASQLISMGFNYLKEFSNGQTIYAFVNTPQLEKYLVENYNNKDFIRSNVLSFGRRTTE